MFEQLRAWRGATAKEQSVPAYVVFHDATLRAIAVAAPSTLAELAESTASAKSKLSQVRRVDPRAARGGSRGVTRAEQPQWVADNFVSVFAPQTGQIGHERGRK